MSKLPELAHLLTTLPELGPGPRAGALSEAVLEAELDKQLKDRKLSRRQRELAHALLLLWHDHLDSAHRIAQSINDADGAFVHGIMHRREPDFGNASYWFHRVGQHAAFPTIAKGVAGLPASEAKEKLLGTLAPGGEWNPFAFIQACEHASAVTEPFLRQAQKIETEALLAHVLNA